MQQDKPTAVDRFGVWLSGRSIRRFVPSFAGKRVGDFGCGFQAAFARTIAGEAASLVLVDVSLADDLKADGRIRAIEGRLPGALASIGDASLDVVMMCRCSSTSRMRRRCCARCAACSRPGACAGQRAVLARQVVPRAVRVSPGPEPGRRDGRPQDVLRRSRSLAAAGAAGFRPSRHPLLPHKFGLNTFAVCQADG